MLSIANLPTPSAAKKAFVGWYYDKNYNKAVADGDPLSENLSLYAKMVDYDTIEGVETPTYAGATDVGPDFKIIIKSNSSETDLTNKIKLIGTEQEVSGPNGDPITVVGDVRKITMAPTPLRHPQTDGQRAALIRWYWRITVCTLTAKRPPCGNTTSP